MFSILSETLMTASRMDGFRYSVDASLKMKRQEPRVAETWGRKPTQADSTTTAD